MEWFPLTSSLSQRDTFGHHSQTELSMFSCTWQQQSAQFLQTHSLLRHWGCCWDGEKNPWLKDKLSKHPMHSSCPYHLSLKHCHSQWEHGTMGVKVLHWALCWEYNFMFMYIWSGVSFSLLYRVPCGCVIVADGRERLMLLNFNSCARFKATFTLEVSLCVWCWISGPSNIILTRDRRVCGTELSWQLFSKYPLNW